VARLDGKDVLKQGGVGAGAAHVQCGKLRASMCCTQDARTFAV